MNYDLLRRDGAGAEEGVMTFEQRAERIVDALIEDLSDRRGLRHEWDQIDDDIRDEIRKRWVELTVSNLGNV